MVLDVQGIAPLDPLRVELLDHAQQSGVQDLLHELLGELLVLPAGYQSEHGGQVVGELGAELDAHVPVLPVEVHQELGPLVVVSEHHVAHVDGRDGLHLEGAREDLLGLVQRDLRKLGVDRREQVHELLQLVGGSRIALPQPINGDTSVLAVALVRVDEQRREELVVGEIAHDPLSAVPSLKPKPVEPLQSPVNSIISMACSRCAAGTTKRSSNLASEVR